MQKGRKFFPQHRPHLCYSVGAQAKLRFGLLAGLRLEAMAWRFCGLRMRIRLSFLQPLQDTPGSLQRPSQSWLVRRDPTSCLLAQWNQHSSSQLCPTASLQPGWQGL
jgi:hypothetical protein